VTARVRYLGGMERFGSLRPVVVLGVLASCGGSSGSPAAQAPGKVPASAPAAPAPGAVTAEDEPPKARLLALFAKLSKEMSQSDPSCDRFSHALGAWLATHGDEIRDLLILDLSDSDHEEIEEAITDTATRVVSGASECGASSAAMASYDEFEALVL